jgi:hypothetical protein
MIKNIFTFDFQGISIKKKLKKIHLNLVWSVGKKLLAAPIKDSVPISAVTLITTA